MKTGIYTRVSTGRQVDEGYSLTAQEERCRTFAAAHGWEVTGTFREEGISGRRIDRPVLTDLRSRIKGGEFQRVIVFKMSRLGRSAKDVLTLIDEFKAGGAEVIFLDEGLDTSKPSSKLIITILAAVAEMESDNTGSQVKLGMGQAASSGRWMGGVPPFGTKVEDGFLVENSDNAETLRLMVSLVMNGSSTQEVADAMNAEGRKPPRGGIWKSAEVRRHLRSDHLFGAMEWAGQATFVPTLIDRAKWDRLQRVLDVTSLPSGANRSKEIYALSGRLTCSCGGTLVGASRSWSNKKIAYYRCQNHTGDAKGACQCDHDQSPTRPKWFQVDELETEIWNQLVAVLRDQRLLDQAIAQMLGLDTDGVFEPERLKSIKRTVVSLNDGVAEARADYYAASGKERAVLKVTVERLVERLRKAEVELERIEGTNGDRQQAEKLAETWRKAAKRYAAYQGVPSPNERVRLFRNLDVRGRIRKRGFRRGALAAEIAYQDYLVERPKGPLANWVALSGLVVQPMSTDSEKVPPFP